MSAHGIFYKKLRARSTLFYGFCAVCVGVVALNIIYSQKYNKNMYGVMEGDNVAIITYLKHVWGSPLFDLELDTYKATGRNDILLQWEEVKLMNERRIQSLESALSLHPYSPELYYNLYLLYLENGDVVKASENLRKAQEIDPAIK